MPQKLTDILMISILAVIAGAQGWEDIETYGLSKQAWLEEFLALPNGIPCADTFRRVFERIDKEVLRGKLPPQTLRPKAFEQCFQRWVGTLVEHLGAQVIPIDGKTLKGSYDRERQKSALHVVSAWASEHRLRARTGESLREIQRNYRHSCPIGGVRPVRLHHYD